MEWLFHALRSDGCSVLEFCIPGPTWEWPFQWVKKSKSSWKFFSNHVMSCRVAHHLGAKTCASVHLLPIKAVSLVSHGQGGAHGYFASLLKSLGCTARSCGQHVSFIHVRTPEKPAASTLFPRQLGSLAMLMAWWYAKGTVETKARTTKRQTSANQPCFRIISSKETRINETNHEFQRLEYHTYIVCRGWRIKGEAWTA